MIRKDISYGSRSANKNLLDVFYEEGKKDLPVLLFIHGGSWMTGSKDLYSTLGGNFLKKGFVTVVISYRLFPTTDVFGMVEDCRDALQWCKNEIGNFGGDANRIYLAGHSAGGHLAAVAGLRENIPSENIAGFILIDAFGLCAFHFLSEHGMLVPEFLADIFGREKERWSGVSPEKLLKENLPPFLVLTGGATYPFLYYDNEKFVTLLKKFQIPHEHRIIIAKTHMQMIFQFETAGSPVYDDVMSWIKSST